MPNINAVLKSEIVRLSKRTTNPDIRSLRSATFEMKRQVAALKKQLHLIANELASVKRLVSKSSGQATVESEKKAGRFVANGFKSHRVRLGLTQETCAQLLGVSPMTIYNWEKGTKPRPSVMPRIVEMRKLGRREAVARLEQLSPKRRGAQK